MSEPLSDLIGNEMAEPVEVLESDDEVVVDVLDDRPEEDQRNYRDPEAGEFDPDEEIADVSQRAKKRIKKLRYEYHEERRNKESADRMREEAVRFAEGLAKENRDLKELLHRGEKVLLTEIKSRADADMDKAREAYKTAYDAGDTDALVAAQEMLTRSQYESEIASRTPPAVPPPPQAPPAVPQSQPLDPKLQDWLQKNDWFGQDQELTSFAYGVHEKLVAQDRVDPRSDEYYSRLDGRLRQVFPEKFGGGMGQEEPSASPRTNTVVAPAGRSSGKPRKVQLTSTQVALAKRLGITPEQYAKQLLKEYSSG